mmetsp:Transcript_28885/g.47907  ORF Transcript_28885/g.47907 Transcript_28885/m.47907 type:complete len:253 (+) Transcript_28885:504-1262(+)
MLLIVGLRPNGRRTSPQPTRSVISYALAASMWRKPARQWANPVISTGWLAARPAVAPRPLLLPAHRAICLTLMLIWPCIKPRMAQQPTAQRPPSHTTPLPLHTWPRWLQQSQGWAQQSQEWGPPASRSLSMVPHACSRCRRCCPRMRPSRSPRPCRKRLWVSGDAFHRCERVLSMMMRQRSSSMNGALPSDPRTSPRPIRSEPCCALKESTRTWCGRRSSNDRRAGLTITQASCSARQCHLLDLSRCSTAPG